MNTVSCFLHQEFTLEADQQLNRTLMKKTENLRVRLPEDIEVRLWRTDQLLKNGRKGYCCFSTCRNADAVLKCRDIKPQLYCYYQYLELFK